MVYEIVWTPLALESYLNNIRYLEEHWSKGEIDAFIKLVDDALYTLSTFPFSGVSLGKKKIRVRKMILHKHVVLFYRIHIENNLLELLLFWNPAMNPSKLRLK